MSDLAVVEGSDPHEDAASDRHVELACGVEPALHLERPEPGGPAGCTSNVGAIARKLAAHNDARNHGPDRDEGVGVGRIGYGILIGHEPACAVTLAVIGIEVDIAH